MPKRIEEIAKGRTNLFSLNWRQCEPATIQQSEVSSNQKPVWTKLNTREDFGDIPEFALSLADGVKETLLGYMGNNGKFQITNGERRWQGAKWLEENKGIKVLLPCRREEKGYSPKERNLDLLRTNNGKSLAMIEQAHAMKRLKDDGMQEKEIATKAGCSLTHVTDCLFLLSDVAPEIQNEVKKGTIKATLAVDLGRAIPDKGRQVAAFKEGENKAGLVGRDSVEPGPRKAIEKGKKVGSRSVKRVTAKHLPVATGKKAQAAKKTPKSNATRMTSAAAPLCELLDVVQRSDCEDTARFDTLEFLIEFLEGRKPLAMATKFILGVI